MGRGRSWLVTLVDVLVLLLFSAAVCKAADRCAQFKLDVRREHERVFGLNYPWWYSLGQLRQESQCRPDIVAFDGGQGIAQFMPSTTLALSKEAGLPLNPFKPSDAARLQAIYLHKLQTSCIAPALWASPYQAYNGGCKLLKVEERRAGSWNHTLMFQQCHRRILTLKNGSKLDLCKVNYSYPELIYRYGQAYRIGADQVPFWSEK